MKKTRNHHFWMHFWLVTTLVHFLIFSYFDGFITKIENEKRGHQTMMTSNIFKPCNHLLLKWFKNGTIWMRPYSSSSFWSTAFAPLLDPNVHKFSPTRVRQLLIWINKISLIWLNFHQNIIKKKYNFQFCNKKWCLTELGFFVLCANLLGLAAHAKRNLLHITPHIFNLYKDAFEIVMIQLGIKW